MSNVSKADHLDQFLPFRSKRARFDSACVAMDGVEQHPGHQLSVLSVIKSIFEDFNLVELSEDVYNHVLDIISSKWHLP